MSSQEIDEHLRNVFAQVLHFTLVVIDVAV
jgi:hypothetical protein